VTTITFQHCRLEVDHADRYMETVFEDGSVAPARPNFEPSDITRAHDLGYDGDTWQMTLDHELMHTWVAEMMGQPYSVILWNVAHGGKNRWPPGGKEEEGYVTSMQRFLRLGVPDDLTAGFLVRSGLTPKEVVLQAHALMRQIREAA
jgi:hypothetical protein